MSGSIFLPLYEQTPDRQVCPDYRLGEGDFVLVVAGYANSVCTGVVVDVRLSLRISMSWSVYTV